MQQMRLAARRRQVLRRRALALMVVLVSVAVFALLITSVISPAGTLRRPAGGPGQGGGGGASTTASGGRPHVKPRPRTPRPVRAGTYGVAAVTLHLIDHTRTITLPSGQVVPRPVTTIVRYPTLKDGAGGTWPDHRDGPFPLIIFGHGFNVLPSLYARLLHYWTSAGFVVAAPIFPLENPDAPGGPDENDLLNQPQDMRFVITSMLHLSAQPSGRFSHLLDAHEIAVTGQSDGGDTALAVAYDPPLRDPRVKAAVILSGAEIPMLPAFQITPGGPPLLATQGTADIVNLPSATDAFFDSAEVPKYLLQLIGASHLGPYSTNRVQLGIVQRVTTAFLQHYLEHDRRAALTLLRSGDVPGVATLQADLGSAAGGTAAGGTAAAGTTAAGGPTAGSSTTAGGTTAVSSTTAGGTTAGSTTAANGTAGTTTPGNTTSGSASATGGGATGLSAG